MNKSKFDIEIKGQFVKDDNLYSYKNDLIICNREGSVVKLDKDSVSIKTDVTGIDKVYVEIKNNKITISNIFKDFINNKINVEFIKFQELKGYVPFPFTILENVIKTPPGLVTRFYRDDEGNIKYDYEPSSELKIFDKLYKFKRKNFKKEFTELLIKDAQDQKELIPSFSGGFDSLFLTCIYDYKVKYLLHFSEDKKINLKYYKQVFPDKKWIITTGHDPFSEKEKKDYFKNIDEPCCDSAGFAEYVMIRKLNQQISPSAVMNGQSSDVLFGNGKKYLQEFISSKLPSFLKNISEHNTNSWFRLKLHRYTQNTKKRFESQYLSKKYEFLPHHKREIDKIYYLYKKNILNDTVHFLASMTMMLVYSLTILEKMKTTAKIFDTKYYLPFLSMNIVNYAFSIPPKYKVGYKIGKRIIRKEYSEISRIKYTSRDFEPQLLKEKFIERKLTEDEYRKYFIKNWVKHNMRKDEFNKIKTEF